MRQTVAVLVLVVTGLSPWTSPTGAFAQQRFEVPCDGLFHVEVKPAYGFKATLAEDWTCPNAGKGTLHIYAPVLPELPSQRKVSTDCSSQRTMT